MGYAAKRSGTKRTSTERARGADARTGSCNSDTARTKS
jgi:hypothetical protein